jgi:GSCFA family
MSSLKLKLSLAAKPSPQKIGYQDSMLLIGSCFSENIGAKLKSHQFRLLENPHGILFNPISVIQSIQDYITAKIYTPQDLFLYQDVWHSWNHHSRFSGITPQESLQKINESIQHAHLFLKNAQHIVITLGSAWLYQINQEAPLGKGQVVANNHKAPALWFQKELMQPEALKKELQHLIHQLQAFNPSINIVFTISPVRHLREGLVENNKSKAVLIYAVHEVVASEKQVAYFPAYEFVIDDLRDYRFYAEDLVHPNHAASQYVWEKWVETYMSEETQLVMKQVAELEIAKQHKPFFVGSKNHQQFLLQNIDKTKTLLEMHPYLPLASHLDYFKSQLITK